MSQTDTRCLRCTGPLGDAHRSGKMWGAHRWHHGRLCQPCWSRSALGSLLYSADVCHAVPCRCGWCQEWKPMQATKEINR